MISGITIPFANNKDTFKQYRTTNELHIFFTNKEVEIFNLHKILQSKNVLSKKSSDMITMIFLWLLVNSNKL